jgi:hypothetical protein
MKCITLEGTKYHLNVRAHVDPLFTDASSKVKGNDKSWVIDASRDGTVFLSENC